MKRLDRSRRIVVHGLVVVSMLLCMEMMILASVGEYAVRVGSIHLNASRERIVIYNHGFAYEGGIIGISGRNSTPDHTVAVDLPGICFRHFRDPPVAGWWTITVSIWYLLPAEIL